MYQKSSDMDAHPLPPEAQKLSGKAHICLSTLPKNAYSMFLSYNTIDILIQHALFQWSQKWEMIWKSSDSLKPSGKWGMIWKSLDSCEKIRKMGNDLEKSGQL